MKVEVCANSLQSARNAQAAGADRIELCSELAVGGITPSCGVLRVVRAAISIPIHVLIRPRSGNFCFTQSEFEAMLEDIRICTDLGMDGVVSGVLLPDGAVDLERTRILREAAGSKHFTFHRAFDRCSDPQKALAGLDALGVDTILSSGQSSTAEAGLPLLERLQARAAHCRLMPGGGIGPHNAGLFAGKGFDAVHLSGIPPRVADAPFHGPPMNSPDLLREQVSLHTDPGRIAGVVRVLKAHGL